MKRISTALGLVFMTHAMAANAAGLRPDQVEFRGLYKELVETNTAHSNGSCTLAAERMAARLKAAGFADSDLTLFKTEAAPLDGGLVAVLPGTSKTLKPMLLLAHIDVVEAKREDWTRDPFTLVEENGYFYARGSKDDKAMAAIWTDALARFRKSGYKPKRTIKMALTCGEETEGVFNGANWLTANRKDLIDAAFVLNEGGGGRKDGNGKLFVQTLQVGEKAFQNFTLGTTNAGGHSSIPVPDNAIYQLSKALLKVQAFDFPLMMSDTTRAYFARSGATRKDELGQAMIAISKNPGDKAAEAILNKDRTMHSLLRTTCVATMLDGGHATNALPQRATANVNCRIFPGVPITEVKAMLERVIADPGVTITPQEPIRPVAAPPPLDPKILGPVETLSAKYYPGVPVVPAMSTGATDGVFFAGLGIPVYGVPGIWTDPDGNGTHGLNERLEVESLYTGRDYLTDLVKVLADGN